MCHSYLLYLATPYYILPPPFFLPSPGLLAIQLNFTGQDFPGGLGFPGGTVVKNTPANAGDTRDAGLIPGSGRSPGVGNGNPLHLSCPQNSMDRGAWWATVHEVAKSHPIEHEHMGSK